MTYFNGSVFAAFLLSSATAFSATAVDLMPAAKVGATAAAIQSALTNKPLACESNQYSTVWLNELAKTDEIQRVHSYVRNATALEQIRSGGKVSRVLVPDEMVLRNHREKSQVVSSLDDPNNLVTQMTVELSADLKSVVAFKIEEPMREVSGRVVMATVDRCK